MMYQVSGLPCKSNMAANMAGKGHILARSNVSFLRSAIPGRHAPNMKKKSKQQLVTKKRKPGDLPHPKSREVVPPVDPDAYTNPYLLEANRERQKRELTSEEKEKNILIEKEWARFKMNQHREDLIRIQRLAKSREDALKELKKCSVYLYEEAVKVNKNLFPVTVKGPTETPPIKDYFAPEPDLRKS